MGLACSLVRCLLSNIDGFMRVKVNPILILGSGKKEESRRIPDHLKVTRYMKCFGLRPSLPSVERLTNNREWKQGVCNFIKNEN